MTNDDLLRCLAAISIPDGVEEWLQPNEPLPSLPADGEYQRGVYDMLAALGMLTDDGKLASPMAYYFIRSLQASLTDKALEPSAWQGMAHEGCAGTGARLVQIGRAHV